MMILHIDKFKTENDTYMDSEGCEFNTAEEFIIDSIFGFCGCGEPDITLDFIRNELNNIKNKTLNYTGSNYFAWYVFDKLNITEHGSSVPGWLTTKGEELLSDLNILNKNKQDASNY